MLVEITVRKICIVVASRANYSSIKSVMRAIDEHPALELQVVLAAAALLDRYGAVSKLIESDGFRASARVHMLVEGETPVTMAKSTGMGLIELPTIFDRLQPDVVLTVGDRFETMATVFGSSPRRMIRSFASSQAGKWTFANLVTACRMFSSTLPEISPPIVWARGMFM